METSKPKVLVIDDDPIHAETLAMVLNISGFQATAVNNRRARHRIGAANPFDHLVTDVVAPNP